MKRILKFVGYFIIIVWGLLFTPMAITYSLSNLLNYPDPNFNFWFNIFYGIPTILLIVIGICYISLRLSK